jgi:LPS sulfotransferase NodH
LGWTDLYFPEEVFEFDNPHLAEAKKLFPPSDGLIINKDIRYIFVCFTNRCGSNFFCDALASGQSFNLAGEFFNGDTMREVSAAEGLTNISDYLKFLTVQEAVNNVLVSKITLMHLMVLYEFNMLPYFVQNASFVFIQRQDLLAQAISMQIAEQTKAWTSQQNAVISDEQLHMSLPDIAMTLDDFAFQNYLWSKFFAHNNLKWSPVTYEALVQAPVSVLSGVSNLLEMPIKFDEQKLVLKSQSRAVNERWRAEYLARI